MRVTQEDYNAGLLALQVYDRIHSRSPFGRSTTIVENAKWDNGRKVLAYYESHLSIDEPWKKENREQYISDGGKFLNRLNEAYHKDGYHIGMTGLTEGFIYVARDAENNNYEYNSSEGEYMYEQECAYRQYLINKAYCQKQLRGMVVEAAILSDDQISISEKVDKLYSINEGLGDSVKDAWGKFKAFLAKIWQKFSEFIARTVNTDKGYLEKYKDIILHRKWKDDQKDLDIDAQYTVGITRLSQFAVATPTAQDVNNKLTGNDDTDLKTYQAKLMPAYRGNNTVDFADFCKHWFKGGDGKGGKHNLTGGEINFTDMYNFCYNYKKIHNNINKNQSIMQNAATVFENAAKEHLNKQKQPTAAPAQPDDKNKQNGSATTTDKKSNYPETIIVKDDKGVDVTRHVSAAEKTSYDQEISTAGNDKTKLKGVYSKYISKGKSNDEFNNLTESFKYKGKLGTFVLEDVGVSSNTGGTGATSGSFGRAGVKAGNTVQMADTSTKVDPQEEKDLTKKIGFFTSASGTLFASMCTAAETIKKDYMKIIKMHVQSYLGEDKDSENKIAQQAGTNRDVNIKYDDDEKGWVNNQDSSVVINNKNYGSLNAMKEKEKNEDPKVKAEVNEFLNALARKHPSNPNDQSSAPSRTYGTIEEYIQAVQSQIEQQKPADNATVPAASENTSVSGGTT